MSIPGEMRAGGSFVGLAPGSVCRVLFAEICRAMDKFTQSDNSCAEYWAEKEKYTHSNDIVIRFSDEFSVGIRWYWKGH
jgi:hypothetical protein